MSEQSPMVQIDWSALATAPDTLSISERPFGGYVNMRGNPDNQAFMTAAQAVLGTLPLAPNTFTAHGDNTVFWLGPDEWLIMTPQGAALDLVAELRSALGNVFAAVTDVTGGNTCVELSGSAARDLLAKGSPIDFHPSVFSTGQCAQTVMAKTAVIIMQSDDAPIFKIVVRRSFADYLGVWLLDAAREFEA